VGYLAHETFIYGRLTAIENLRFWAGLYGASTRERELLGMLDRLGLKRVAFERAKSFSRGMAQRLSLARVLMTEPKVLFMDEPGTGLDEASKAILVSEIDAARQRGAAVAWVSHDATGDAERADRVLALEAKAAQVMPAGEWLSRRKAAAC
jgi:heme exporter protein A